MVAASLPSVVVLCSDADGVGGIETATRTLYIVLDSSNENPRMVSLQSSRFKAGRRRAAKAAFIFAALRATLGLPPDAVIVATHLGLAPVAWFCSLMSHRPFVVWFHGREVWRPASKLKRMAVDHAAAIWSVSEFTQRESFDWLPRRHPAEVLLHHGLQEAHLSKLARISHCESSFTRIVTLSRLDPQNRYKGIDTLIRATAALATQSSNLQLSVIGGGEDRAYLENLARQLGVSDMVTFHGRLEWKDIEDIYAESTIFALPSRQRSGLQAEGDGFGIATIEACAAALPVVVGEGGCSASIVEGVTGISATPADLSHVLAGITLLLDDPAAARRMGEAGREHVLRNFSEPAFANRVRAALRAVRVTNAAEPRRERVRLGE